MQLARNLAVEWGPSNVRVNCIAPGLVQTDFAKYLWENPDLLKQVDRARAAEAHRPAGRDRRRGGLSGVAGLGLHDRPDPGGRRRDHDCLVTRGRQASLPPGPDLAAGGGGLRRLHRPHAAAGRSSGPRRSAAGCCGRWGRRRGRSSTVHAQPAHRLPGHGAGRARGAGAGAVGTDRPHLRRDGGDGPLSPTTDRIEVVGLERLQAIRDVGQAGGVRRRATSPTIETLAATITGLGRAVPDHLSRGQQPLCRRPDHRGAGALRRQAVRAQGRRRARASCWPGWRAASPSP